ncbi:outer membrane biogenesis protein BamB [Polystyrenella longa]|uniref:Outer membrane biogenesis protein BamB n=1 Tax=Polystyrenella longa TaxID=2528007 RepID=A0A518CR57_9PLAN|nr:PQQ-binding-like beta-propeller repeat protein [Polystyrenella longa]QDU81684.1 outer membrane biogenesis protein BamB [Polystyrenella longa]
MPQRLVFWLFACSLILTFAIAADSLQAEDWPQWRGPSRDGISNETGLNFNWEQNPPKLLWKTEGLGNGYASVAVVGDRIYTTSNGEVSQALLAIDANTHQRLWASKMTDHVPKHGYDGSRCTPAVDGDYLYVIPSNGKIICMKTADGEIVWEKDFAEEWDGKMMSSWGFSESPLVDGDWVLCTPGGNDAMIVALDKLTGEEVWKSKAPTGEKGNDGAGYASIQISNAAGIKQYVQMGGHGAFGVRASDGELLWSYNPVANGTANIPDLLVDGDYIFCSTSYNTGAAYLHLTKDGEGVKATEQYFLRPNTFQNHHGNMILLGDYVYAGHGHKNGFPICIKTDSGDITWGGKIRGPGTESAAIIYADGHLIFRYQSGEVAAIKATPDGYELSGSFTPDVVNAPAWAHPAIANGKLYLRDQETLMVYDLAN